MKATRWKECRRDGSKRKERVKWVVSVIPISVNKLNMPNKALRASAWGEKKKP